MCNFSLCLIVLAPLYLVASLSQPWKCFSFSVHLFIVFCQGKYASASITRRMHDNQLLSSIDIISSIWSFFKPIESLQACISKASLHHQRSSLRLLSTLMTHENWLAEILWLSWLCYNKTCHSVIQICLSLGVENWTLRRVILRRYATSLRRLPERKHSNTLCCLLSSEILISLSS